MASRDIANMHFFLDLKKKFPHLPDELIRRHVSLFSEDQEKCVSLLQKEAQDHHHHLSTQPFSDFRLPESGSKANNSKQNEDPVRSVPTDFGSRTKSVKPEPRSAPVLHGNREPFSDIYRQNSSQDDSFHLPSKTIFSTTKEHEVGLAESRMDYFQGLPEQSGRRHTVRLSIMPSLPYQQQQQPAYAGMSHSSRPGRHRTSVNFQLQPRSSLDRHPFVISTIPANVADPSNSGSHVQISVGSRGATFTALRFQHSTPVENSSSQKQNSYLFSEKSPNSGANPKSAQYHPAQSSPGYILAVKNEQIARLDLILEVLEKEKALCSQLRAEVSRLERMVENSSNVSSFSYAEKVKELREENKQLRLECNCLSIETDMYDSSEIPPCDTEDFYTHIFTGPNGAVPPPPPPHPQDSAKNKPDVRQNCQQPERDDDDDEKTRWICKKCTFANFPGLEECEMCEMPKDTECADSASVHFPPPSKSLPPRLPGRVQISITRSPKNLKFHLAHNTTR